MWIISETDMDDLKELVEMTLLYRKAYKHDQTEFQKEFAEFKANVLDRLRRLESIAISQ